MVGGGEWDSVEGKDMRGTVKNGRLFCKICTICQTRAPVFVEGQFGRMCVRDVGSRHTLLLLFLSRCTRAGFTA